MLHLLTQRCKLVVVVITSLFSSVYSFGQTTVPVAVASAEKKAIYQQVEITGSVTSPQVSQLSVATNGLIVEILAEEGDRVQRGDPLLSLDAEIAKQDLASAKAQVKQADIALKDAKRRLKEAESLGSKGGIAETVIEDIRSEVAQDRANLSRFRADAARQQAIVDRHTLKAPYTGVISRRLAEVGEWVTPGSGVFELVATENLRLDFALAEDFLTRVSTDTAIEFNLNALPGETFTAHVKAIVPVAEPGARTFLLRVTPDVPVPQMMPGLSVVATLSSPTARKGLVVPDDALIRYPDGRLVVWVVTQTSAGSAAREKPVTIGRSFNGKVNIVSGLNEGDRVIIQGNEALQDGQSVRIVRANGS